MESAFGVEHGDIAKSWNATKVQSLIRVQRTGTPRQKAYAAARLTTNKNNSSLKKEIMARATRSDYRRNRANRLP